MKKIINFFFSSNFAKISLIFFPARFYFFPTEIPRTVLNFENFVKISLKNSLFLGRDLTQRKKIHNFFSVFSSNYRGLPINVLEALC